MTKTQLKTSAGDSAPQGEDGEIRLAAGESLSMRMWKDEAPGADKPPRRNGYETLGYVLAGRAELVVEGETIPLAPGDSWRVPKGAEHTYRILEPFTAVEATSPPAVKAE